MKVSKKNLDFVLAQPSSSFQENIRKARQEEDAFMKKETSKTCQLEVTEVRNQVLQHCRKETDQEKTLQHVVLVINQLQIKAK